ncbi:MAG: hypothetical protein U0694_24410 [Anaerolineae bacterium]
MERFLAFDPANETIGASLVDFVQYADPKLMTPIVEKHGFTKIDPARWYPLQAWLDVLTDVAHSPGGWQTLVAIGQKVGAALPMPPEVNTLEQALLGAKYSLPLSHRGGYVGEVDARVMNDRHIQLIQLLPYPDNTAYGTFYGLSRRFLQGQKHALTIHSNQAGKNRYPRRDSDPLILDIQW